MQRTAARRREGLHGTACAPDAGAAQALSSGTELCRNTGLAYSFRGRVCFIWTVSVLISYSRDVLCRGTAGMPVVNLELPPNRASGTTLNHPAEAWLTAAVAAAEQGHLQG